MRTVFGKQPLEEVHLVVKVGFIFSNVFIFVSDNDSLHMS